MASNVRARRLLLAAFIALAVGVFTGCRGATGDVVVTNDGAAETAETPEPRMDTDAETSDGDGMGDSEASDEGEPIPIDRDALMASTWNLRFGGGPGGDVPVVDGWPITINFDQDTFGGRAACNGYGGTYTIEGTSALVLGEISQTAMGCRADVQESEAAFMEALQDVDGIDLIDDQLALSGMATELIFFPTEAAPIDALVNRTWLLTALVDQGEESVPLGEPATLRIDADGSFAGSTGCRGLVGRYSVFGDSIRFNEMTADGECPTSLFDQDSHVVTVLGDGFVATIDGDVVTLGSVGDQALRYRAVTEDELAAATEKPAIGDDALLEGTEWVFAGGDSSDGVIADPRTLDPAATITLTFGEGGYAGTVICNGYGGEADIGASLGSFTLGVPGAEEEGCGDGLDDIAAAYLDALPQMIEGGIEDSGRRLVINGNDIELHFTRAD